MHFSTLQIILSVLSGGAVGFVLGLIGGGGSILAVPLLLYVVGIHDPHVVIGTTSFAVAANAFLNVIPHWRAGHVKGRAAIAFAIPGALAAYAGSVVGKLVNGKVLLFLFALLMLVIAAWMLKPQREPNGENGRQMKMGRVIPAGLLTGWISGFFGIGGGFLIVPALMFSTGMAMIDAIGSSLVSVGVFGLTTAVSYALSGMVDWFLAALYVAGGVLGGIAGAKAAVRLNRNRRVLRYLFSGLIVLVALDMLYVNMEVLQTGGMSNMLSFSSVGWIILAALAVYLVYRMVPVKGVGALPAEQLPEKLKEKGVQLVDVRERHEFRAGHIPGARNIPLRELKQQLDQIPKDTEVLLVCRSGARSMQAARVLKRHGFDKVTNVTGGILRWNGRIER